ncbi:MAG: hypothetical protein JNM07_08090 [Phycisphaerae bacterium]|nr:hypothetical protein [Phycisphaerae bacterium]
MLPTAGVALSSCLALVFAAGGSALPGPINETPNAITRSQFLDAHPRTHLYTSSGRVTSVYGQAFAQGASPVATASAFIEGSAVTLFGVPASDLSPGSLAADNAHVRQIMIDRDNGGYKFSLVSFLQTRDGLPVFESDLRLLVRNETGFPLVLARSALRDLGAFRPDRALAASPNAEAGRAAAIALKPGLDAFTPATTVIYAGTSDEPAPARVATVFEGSKGAPGANVYEKWLFVTDAATGEVLHSRSLISHVDIPGTVKAMVTPGKKADNCATEVLTPLPYARVVRGTTTVFADKNGNFVMPYSGTTAVSLSSGIRGQWFRVFTPSADATVLTQSITPPGPANFVHNQPNNVERDRASVNAYYNANVVRDHLLTFAPTFPTIPAQAEFRVNVMVSGTCNAFYDGGSINFYPAGGGCPDTAYGDVVHHEYGHHIVAVAGSGQGMYGEGFGDLMGVIISDDPILGYGFTGDCNSGIRSAVNNKMYPCNGEIHDCGQLITGCFWDTRNAMVAASVSGYLDILSDLACNSVLLHTGTEITPQITIDVMTLDDTDTDITNGTPNYAYIQQGFSLHNMPGPALNLINYNFPNGRPALIDPAGGPAFVVQILPVNNTVITPGSTKLFADPENDGSFAAYALNPIGVNTYEAVFPASTCGTPVRYYISAQANGVTFVTSPDGAPLAAYTATAASTLTVAFTDNFETDTGWTRTNTNMFGVGSWARAVPVNADAGDPEGDFDGSGRCYVTDNTANRDVAGTVTLTTPTINATGGEFTVSYARWFSNNNGGNPNQDIMTVAASNNNGSSWVTLETVGPAGPDAGGGWRFKSFKISDFLPPTATMKFRFTASDLGGPSTVEAAVDAFSVQLATCGCPADFNGDTSVDDFDLFDFLNAFNANNPSADFNGDTSVDDFDLFDFLNAFGLPC